MAESTNGNSATNTVDATNTNGSSNNSNNAAANDGAPTACLAYTQVYLTLFGAHWFGARRFDRVSQPGDFDPEDMQAYRAQKGEFLKRNFTRSRSITITAASSGAEAQAPPELQAQEEDGTNATSDGAAAAEAGQVGHAEAGGADAQEERVVTSKQVFPRFVLVQSFLMCSLYLVFALKKYAEDKMTGTDPWLAGLDSVSSGSTDLRWAGENCEDHRHEVWRWITYQWTHIGVGHVLTNTALLIVFGTALEGHEGSIRMFLIFNIGVIAGALCWFVGGAHGYVVGSSGGVYALIGLHFEDLIMNWRERHFRKVILFILLAFALTDALTWVMSQGLTKADYSYSAALGGGLGGLMLGSFIGRDYFVTKRDSILTAVLGSIGFALVVIAVCWLATNEAPINIWEAASGENGYCWVAQFYNANLNATSYQCVRCGTQECIQTWSLQENILPVKVSACASQGWYYDGR